MTTLPRPFAPRRLRAAGPQRQRGVASLLRLSQHSAPRLPSGSALAGWMSRAADLLGAPREGAFVAPGGSEATFVASVPGTEPNAMITRLLPSSAGR
jgi:hypothetical protein